MRRFRYAFNSLKYHKVLGILLAVVFTLFLIGMCLVDHLVQIETANNQNLNERFDTITDFLPNGGVLITAMIKKTHTDLLGQFNGVRSFLLFLFFAGMIVLFISCLHMRKGEVHAMKRMGLRVGQIVQLFFIEILIPALVAFLIVFGVFAFFSSEIDQGLANYNQGLFLRSLPQGVKIVYSSEANQTNASTTATTADSRIVDVIPYTEKALFKTSLEAVPEVKDNLAYVAHNFLTMLILLALIDLLLVLFHPLLFR